MANPAPLQVLHAYRGLYRAGLHAVQYSKPNRYVLRDQLRKAFRKEDPATFDQQKIDNTIEFLQIAARERGLEHKIVKNLLTTALWEKSSSHKLPSKNRDDKPMRSHIEENALQHYHLSVAMLNESMGLCLR